MKGYRYPRTLNEAFGPYADQGPIIERHKPSGYPVRWWVLMVVCCIASLAAIALRGMTPP